MLQVVAEEYGSVAYRDKHIVFGALRGDGTVRKTLVTDLMPDESLSVPELGSMTSKVLYFTSVTAAKYFACRMPNRVGATRDEGLLHWR